MADSPRPRRRSRRARYLLVLTALLAGVVLAVIAGVVVGPSGQPPQAVAGALADGVRAAFGGEPAPRDGLHTIVLDIRLPRALVAALIGACLALAGVIMQALFQNPMADPYIVGVSGGAALGAVAVMSLGATAGFIGLSAVPLAAFVGAIVVTVAVYGLSQRGGRVHTATLLLTGVAVGSMAASVTSVLMLSSDVLRPAAIYWLLGGLSGRTWRDLWPLIPACSVGLVATVLLARPLNVLLLGDEAAAHVGLDVHRTRRWLLALSSLLAASAVAVGGVIGFVGLVVPHVCRLIVGPDHRILVPVSALSGALLLVLADIAARMVLAPTELPIGVITSLLGCPFFLYLLRRQGTRRL